MKFATPFVLIAVAISNLCCSPKVSVSENGLAPQERMGMGQRHTNDTEEYYLNHRQIDASILTGWWSWDYGFWLREWNKQGRIGFKEYQDRVEAASFGPYRASVTDQDKTKVFEPRFAHDRLAIKFWGMTKVYLQLDSNGKFMIASLGEGTIESVGDKLNNMRHDSDVLHGKWMLEKEIDESFVVTLEFAGASDSVDSPSMFRRLQVDYLQIGGDYHVFLLPHLDSQVFSTNKLSSLHGWDILSIPFSKMEGVSFR